MITLTTALAAARHTLTTVTERAERNGYYSGARTDIINSHAELRSALDMLIKPPKRGSHQLPTMPDLPKIKGSGAPCPGGIQRAP
jgi:hypothetical protein